MFVRRRACWQIWAVWVWSDVWVWGGHADCWLPRWHTHYRCVRLTNATLVIAFFLQRVPWWCDILLDAIMVYFTGFIGSGLLSQYPNVIYFHKGIWWDSGNLCSAAPLRPHLSAHIIYGILTMKRWDTVFSVYSMVLAYQCCWRQSSAPKLKQFTVWRS